MSGHFEQFLHLEICGCTDGHDQQRIDLDCDVILNFLLTKRIHVLAVNCDKTPSNIAC